MSPHDRDDREASWRFTETTSHGLDEDNTAARDALFTLANGEIGMSGAARLVTSRGRAWLVANGVYTGNGPETRLLTGPILAPDPLHPKHTQYERTLDLHAGLIRERVVDGTWVIEHVRFVSLTRPGVIAMRTTGREARRRPAVLVETLDPALDSGTSHVGSWTRVGSSDAGIVAASAATESEHDGVPRIDEFAAYAIASDSLPEPAVALDRLAEAQRAGFDQLLAEHRRAWADRWRVADIVIEGDDELQRAVRFALFQLMASVDDGPEAAVGARGLTGTSYRGHVFWDADTFVLPFLAATHPRSARAMLEYRVQRLRAALDAAREVGLRGARFPWESAHTGRDVTPTQARDRSGRVLPCRTGELEIHIVADVAWAAMCYTEWSGDESFLRGPGLSLLVETARFWASRARMDRAGAAHVDAVIGPDEYHESVNDNAFTNVMARWNLRAAADGVEAEGSGEQPVDVDEVRVWRELASALVDGYDPHSGVYEQFAGFFRLEPLLIAEVAPRRPIAADVLLGTERVRDAQVIKQADVLMLHLLMPGEVEPASLVPNLEFYEPRTAHGSSLSPAVHAALFARADEVGRAYETIKLASRIDLDDLTGSTGGGLHLATMGGLWQALVFGFVGLRTHAGALEIDPRLPPAWTRLDVGVRYRRSRVRVDVRPDEMHISTDAPLVAIVNGRRHLVEHQRRFAPEVVTLGSDHMSKVLACLDNSAAARPVLSGALALAPVLGAAIEAVHVTEPDESNEGGTTARGAAEAVGLPLRIIVDGDPVAELGSECGFDDVVAVALGVRGRPTGPRPAGHLVLELAQMIEQPLLAIPPESTLADPIRRVLIAMKGNAQHERRLRRALELTAGADIDLVVVHVADESSIPLFSDQLQHETAAYAEQFLRQYLPHAPDARLDLRIGRASDEILATIESERPDVVALGWPHSDDPARGMVARDLMERSRIPMLLVALA